MPVLEVPLAVPFITISQEVAAAVLHIHPNTLAYRLRRFAELTGRDLSATASLTEVWLALRAAAQRGIPGRHAEPGGRLVAPSPRVRGRVRP